jgi:cell division protein FtsB
LEFSFDRSKDAQSRKTETTAAPASAEATGPRPGPDLNAQDPSTIANERLRKAIERNRAKQASREQGSAQAAPQPTQSAPNYTRPEPAAQSFVRPEPIAQPIHEQPSFFEKAKAQEVHHASAQEPVNERPTSPPPPPRSTSVVSRRSVAKPEDTEFVPVKRTTRKVASQISYTTSSTRKKPKSLDPKLSNYLIKGCWIFCAVMVLRLIFSNGGVSDYYAQKATWQSRVEELSSIKKENMTLVREIERMRSDTGYQKKLVRDNLGFIASDEFLVLFPKD